MNSYFYSALITAIACFIVGIGPLLRDKKSPLSIAFFFFSFSIAFWSFGLALHSSATTLITSTRTAIIMHYGVIWIPIFFLQFICEFLSKKNRPVLKLAYFAGIVFSFLNFSGYLVSPSIPKLIFTYFMETGPAYPFLIAFFVSLVLYSLNLLRIGFKTGQGMQKNQIKYILGSTFIGYAGGMTNFFPAYNLWIYPINPYGTLCIVLYLAVLVYAILAFRLFDFNLIARWGFAYVISVGVLLGVLALLVVILNPFLEIVGINQGILVLILSCGLVFLFEPLRQKITGFVDHFIFKSPDFQKILNGISNTLEKESNVTKLTGKLSLELKELWKASHAGFILWNPTIGEFQPYPINGFNEFPISKNEIKIEQDDFLIRTLESERRIFRNGIITEEELSELTKRSFPGEKMTFSKINRTMRWLGARICVPLMSGNTLMGFIILGDKKNGALYNNEDKKFLLHVSFLTVRKVKLLIDYDHSFISA